jgi:hypothetical protein
MTGMRWNSVEMPGKKKTTTLLITHGSEFTSFPAGKTGGELRQHNVY